MVSEISYRPVLEIRFKYFKEILNGIPITGLNFSTNVMFGKETTRTDYLKIWGSYKDEKKIQYKYKVTEDLFFDIFFKKNK